LLARCAGRGKKRRGEGNPGAFSSDAELAANERFLESLTLQAPRPRRTRRPAGSLEVVVRALAFGGTGGSLVSFRRGEPMQNLLVLCNRIIQRPANYIAYIGKLLIAFPPANKRTPPAYRTKDGWPDRAIDRP